MAQTTVLSAGTGAAQSTSIVVGEGATVAVGLFAASKIPATVRLTVQVETPDGGEVIAALTRQTPRTLLCGPGTFFITRPDVSAYGVAVGVFSDAAVEAGLLSSSSSAVALNAAATFTGTASDVSAFASVVAAVLTDQAGTLYMEFSPDGTNWDSSLPFSVAAGVNEIHRLTVTRRYFRVRFTNTSGSNQTYMRLQALGGSQSVVTSPLNGIIQADADAQLVRPLDFNLMVAEGLYQNRQNTIKDGINFDVDTGSVPEDVTNEGGLYAGFPTGAPEAGRVVVAGADTGTVFYSYMASSDDTDYTFGSVAVTGAGTYALGHNIWRCNFAYFIANSTTAFNVGTITIQNTPTTANVFCVIPIGYSQSFCAAYTVPAGSRVYIDRITGNLRGAATGSIEGVFYYRATGESPRYRFPFELQFGSLYFDDVDYLISIPAGVDIVPRVLASSANNLVAKLSYRLIKVKS